MKAFLTCSRMTATIVLASLLVVSGVVAAVSYSRRGTSPTPVTYPTYDVNSSGPQGTRALFLWLADLGYQPTTLAYQSFQLSPRNGILFMLFPSVNPNGQQVASILSWVNAGGTLVLASGTSNTLLGQLNVGVVPLDARRTDVHAVQPWLSVPLQGSSTVDTYGALSLHDPAWVPLLDGSNGEIVAASRSQGNGSIVVLSTGDPFSNYGLTQTPNRDLVLSLLSLSPPGSTAIIDEYHHGFTEQGTFTRQLLTQPWGISALGAALLLFVYLVFTGLRFGPAVQISPRALKRARSEFATTLASMLHQGGHQEWLRNHYLQQLKRTLGSRFGVPVNLATNDFIEQLTERNPGAAALSEPLRRLAETRVPDDTSLVTLIRETERVAATLLRRPVLNNVSHRAEDRLPETSPLAGKTG